MTLPEGTISLHGNEVVIAFNSRDDAEAAFDALEEAMYPPRPMTGFIATLTPEQRVAAGLADRKVLFLDIDGVLNNEGVFRDRRFGPLPLDHFCIERLHNVIRATGAKIVLSSAWRDIDWHEHKLSACFVFEMYERLGSDRITIRHQDGSTKRLSGPRGGEIAEWLSRHPEVTTYAIVDDESDILDEQKPFFVNTRFEDGLTDADADRLIEILGPITPQTAMKESA